MRRSPRRSPRSYPRARVWNVAAFVALLLMAAPAAAMEAQDRIIGGQATTTAEWPWAVYVETGPYRCGGSLIDAEWVLTAAHCLEQVRARDYGGLAAVTDVFAVIGRTDIRTADGQRIQASHAVVHAGYQASNGGDDPNDVALLKLSTPASSSYTPIDVAGADERALWEPDDVATIVGW